MSRTFEWVARHFTGVESYEYDVVALDVGGDMAYTVGFERSLVSVDGNPPAAQELRVTHVYRREDGDWRIVHRQGDFRTPDLTKAP